MSWKLAPLPTPTLETGYIITNAKCKVCEISLVIRRRKFSSLKKAENKNKRIPIGQTRPAKKVFTGLRCILLVTLLETTFFFYWKMRNKTYLPLSLLGQGMQTPPPPHFLGIVLTYAAPNSFGNGTVTFVWEKICESFFPHHIFSSRSGRGISLRMRKVLISGLSKHYVE